MQNPEDALASRTFVHAAVKKLESHGDRYVASRDFLSSRFPSSRAPIIYIVARIVARAAKLRINTGS